MSYIKIAKILDDHGSWGQGHIQGQRLAGGGLRSFECCHSGYNYAKLSFRIGSSGKKKNAETQDQNTQDQASIAASTSTTPATKSSDKPATFTAPATVTRDVLALQAAQERRGTLEVSTL